MRDRWIRILSLLLFLLSLSVVSDPSWAGSDTSLNEAIEQFVEGQRLRIRTSGYSMLWGRFLRAVPDSIYIDLLSAGTEPSGNRRGGSIKMVGIGYTEVDVIWKVGRGGISRGLLYAGGAALAGIVFLFSSKTLEESIVTSMVTIVAIPVAFVWGALSKKERLVYSRSGY